MGISVTEYLIQRAARSVDFIVSALVFDYTLNNHGSCESPAQYPHYRPNQGVVDEVDGVNPGMANTGVPYLFPLDDTALRE